jgi:hypothetical protein
MPLRPYRKGIPIERIRVSGGITVTREGIGPEVTLDGAGAGSTQVHGNEKHSPPFADCYHAHTGSDGSSQVDHANLIWVEHDQHHTHEEPEIWTWDGLVTTHTLPAVPIVSPMLFMEHILQVLNVDFSVSLTTGVITMLRHSAAELDDMVCVCYFISAGSQS